MGEIALGPITMAGTLLSIMLFGMYLIAFAVCMNVLFAKQYRRTSLRAVFTSPMTIAALALFPLIVADCGINVTRLFDAFVYNQDGSPLAFYANTRDGKNVAKNACYIAEMVVADIILIYRLYYVYNRNWKVCVVPSLSILLTFMSGFSINIIAANLDPGEDSYAEELDKWVCAGYASTLVTNLIATPLIGYRVWSAQRAIKAYVQGSTNTSMKIVQIVVESAAIYTAFTFTTFVSYLARSNMQFMFLDPLSPVTGIVFCLIIIRVKLFGRSKFNVSGTVDVPRASAPSPDIYRMPKPPSVYSTAKVAVNVHKEIDVEKQDASVIEIMSPARTREGAAVMEIGSPARTQDSFSARGSAESVSA